MTGMRMQDADCMSILALYTRGGRCTGLPTPWVYQLPILTQVHLAFPFSRPPAYS